MSKFQKNTFEVTGTATIEIRTLVTAKDESEAMRIAKDRDISICIHGTDDGSAVDDWVFVEAITLGNPNDAAPHDE